MGVDAYPVRRFYILQIVVLGCVFSWIRWRSGSALLTIILHALVRSHSLAAGGMDRRAGRLTGKLCPICAGRSCRGSHRSGRASCCARLLRGQRTRLVARYGACVADTPYVLLSICRYSRRSGDRVTQCRLRPWPGCRRVSRSAVSFCCRASGRRNDPPVREAEYEDKDEHEKAKTARRPSRAAADAIPPIYFFSASCCPETAHIVEGAPLRIGLCRKRHVAPRVVAG